MEVATFGAGCFWGVELAFRQVQGVTDSAVGYSGGHAENPTYEEVCAKNTGHAEVVQVTYDPAQVSYEELLAVFWNSHNPTQLNRQGPDVGDQYRTAIFFHTPEQELAAKLSREQLEKEDKFPRPIVTEITLASPFYPAEAYHQDYSQKNPKHYKKYRKGCGRDTRLRKLWGRGH